PEWFTYRTFGWGIKARTWQGWVYFGVFLALLIGPNYLPIDDHLKNLIKATVFGLFLADVIIIWIQLDKVHDERQQLHQLIIERNCSVVAVLSLCAVIVYRAYQNPILPASGSFQLNTGSFPFDPLVLVVLVAMAVTKLISTVYLRYRK
ncbi:MAG TPA: hypothetical protein VNZ67_11175, partial [bacterium]|nr:hypothetical protein [bacterium]